METKIQKSILNECSKLISRHQFRVRQNKKYQKRYRKRTGCTETPPSSYEPNHWNLHKHFNPFYVRDRAHVIAHAIAKKIRGQNYLPNPALIIKIPKPNGGTREITIFTIPDAAVSGYLFKTLRIRNRHLFSSYAYAYRENRNAHHAIEYIYRNIQSTPRLYLLEYDFANYFGAIKHSYIINLLQNFFKVSPRERKLVEMFLFYQKAEGSDAYQRGNFVNNDRGIPQGSSISLFLANAACTELDIKIEQTGSTFARYADDIIILCDTYNMAHKCVNQILAHGKKSGTKINFTKSLGISLLTTEKKTEMRCTEHFDFLGYRLFQDKISIAGKSVSKIKRKISAIIYRHLLLYPRRKSLSIKRIGSNGLDWDMVTCINEIRYYLYGHVTEEELLKCLSDKSIPLTMTKCLLSYYPLVNDPTIFRNLDGWLVSVLHRAQCQRSIIISPQCPNYRIYTRDELITGSWYSSSVPNETRLPSFFKAWLHVRRLLNIYDISHFPAPKYES